MYFAKYLPDQPIVWEWNNTVNNTGWEKISPADMDAIIAHGLRPQPEFRKQGKLFLCNRDIQVGDEFTFEPTGQKSTRQSSDHDDRYWVQGYTTLYDKAKCFKIIGEISPDATWVKEGDEFEAGKGLIYPDNLDGKVQWLTGIKIKGPCGHFH